MKPSREGTVTDTRETRVLAAVASLVDSVLDDFDVVDLLTELTERCAELLDVAAAGFLLADPLQQYGFDSSARSKCRGRSWGGLQQCCSRRETCAGAR